MKILIIDGQGGQLGAQLVKEISAQFSDVELLCVGTNAMASSAMLKAGARQVATGENPVVVACRTADIIVGPIGILAADSLMGEITPTMAVAIGQSSAKKLLLPVNQCNNIVAGVPNLSLSKLMEEAVELLRTML